MSHLNEQLSALVDGELTGTTGVVTSLMNASFCVARPYDPFATIFVVCDTLTPVVTLN